MASKGSIKAGEGYVLLGVDAGPLIAGLNAAKKRVQAWGASIGAIGASIGAAGLAITAPFLAGLTIFADMGSAMLDMSQRTGVAVEALSELVYIAEQSGSSAEELEVAFKGMAKLLSSAADGSKGANDKLRDLGLTLNDMNGKTQAERFEMLVEAISKIDDPAQRAAAAMDIFGKAGLRMMPLIEDGAKGLQAMREESRRLGITMSTEDAKAAEALGDQFSTLGKQAKMFWFNVGAAIAPIAKVVMTALIDIVAATIHWIKANRELFTAIFIGGVILTAIGAIIVTTGALVYGLGIAFGVASTAITIATAAVALFKAILYAEVLPIIFVVTVGLGILAAAVLSFYAALKETGNSAWIDSSALYFLETWKDVFAELMSIVGPAWSAITNALSIGEWAQAFEVSWIAIQLIFEKSVNWIKEGWYSVKFMFLTVAHEISVAISSIFIDLAAFIATTVETASGAALVAWATVQERIGLGTDGLAESEARLSRQRIADIERGRVMANASIANPANAPQLQLADRAGERQLERDLENIQRDLEMQALLRETEANMQRGPAGTVIDEKSTGSSIGTFDAAAIRGFGGNDPLTQIERNTLGQRQILQRVLDRLEQMEGLVAE